MIDSMDNERGSFIIHRLTVPTNKYERTHNLGRGENLNPMKNSKQLKKIMELN